MSKNPDNQAPKAIRLQDYRPTEYAVEHVDLHFALDEENTIVRARTQFKRRKGQDKAPLVLHGEELSLQSLKLNGKPLDTADYLVDEESLTIHEVPEAFLLEIEVSINPAANTSLNGLYTSSGNFCTQCEAEGFRRITYMYDRPDVMARYSTTIEADKTRYPVLLSNGNRIGYGDMEDGRHWAKWEDPHPKPTYLFALVAGDLACIEDHFTTCSDRKVLLQIYVEHHNIDKCAHAMLSLINAMRWDEQVFGREYDLDIYMIVAVDDFNMGAMENKGLNVFNSKFVLAKPETATDMDYQGIEGVIGHEYFHNWSGNRVTCRDWFQLSLKEGFTVFRDQQFSGDMGSKGVKRIQDVNSLRTLQFREDAGPMAHPVRPESYVEINNFYTMTVYNKGAEVVRMLFNLLGTKGFRDGTDLYFERHDGQAVTTDDFVSALEEANDIDLTQFKRWYSQAGTPVVKAKWQYDASNKQFTLNLSQHCPPTPGQELKEPFQIPIAVGLLDAEGNDLPLKLSGETGSKTTRVLSLNEIEENYVFEDIPSAPVPSLLRGFSAPIKMQSDLSDEQRAFLMAHDSDDFNRWDAGQQLAVGILRRMLEDLQQGRALTLDPLLIAAFEKILKDEKVDKALAAQALVLPSESYLAEFVSPIDPAAIHAVRRFARKHIAEKLTAVFDQVYVSNQQSGPYAIDQDSIAQRSLKNCALSYLMEMEDPTIESRCMQQFRDANNMTDVIAALGSIVNSNSTYKAEALAEFYDKWKGDVLVIDKWLAIQASSQSEDTLQNVKALTKHEAFNIKNPNKVRSLIGAFAHGNPVRFHDLSGAGYEFLTEYVIELDRLNPQISSRLVGAFTLWKRYDQVRQSLMRKQLERIVEIPKLSKDVYEIVSKSLL